VQRKIAAPPALAVRSTIQLSGNPGGKGGEGYSSANKKDSDDMRREARARSGLTGGIKGHGKGDTNSNWSSQTVHESEKYHEALREVRAEKKEKARNCRDYHKKKYIGDTCESCGREITAAMCK